MSALPPVRGLVIPVSGKPYTCTISSLGDFQGIVGGYIEGVRIMAKPSGQRATMYVNEEFLIKGLPFNPRASAFYSGKSGICGDVVIVGGPDVEGDDLDVPQAFLAAFEYEEK